MRPLLGWKLLGNSKKALEGVPMFSLDDIFSDRFATQHRLCIAVAGPGHDFLNRHTCGDAPGFMIRTSLLKVGAKEGDGSSWHACKLDPTKIGAPEIRTGNQPRPSDPYHKSLTSMKLILTGIQIRTQ